MPASMTRLAAAVAVALAAAAPPADAATFVYTNPGWRVTASAPGAGWNSDAGFDTASWQAATVLYNVNAYAGYESFSAQGIWTSSGQFSTETTMWARTVWQLDALPQSALLQAGFDDDGTVWVNGVQVAASNNGDASDPIAPVDILPYLGVGANVIAYQAFDNWPVWGYNHSSWLQVDGQMAPPVPEPQTYALMLAGLAATAFVARRRRRSETPRQS